MGFCIVGVGMIARFHARALAQVPGARVAALVSRNPDNARKLAADLGLDCPTYTDLSAALARPDVHALIVTTPSGAHLEPAVAAANAGKHVVVEKPLEITAERCDHIIEACDRNGVQLCAIFPSRFADANRALKAAVDAGRFGRLTLAETACKWQRAQSYYDQGGWKGTQALDGGGALMNQAIHNVDLLLWLMGPATHVTGFTAMLAHERIEVEDTATACLRFASGALGVIQAATSVYPGLPKTIAVHGDRGTAVVEQDDILRWDFTPETAEDRAVKERFAQGGGVGRRQRPGRDLAPGPCPPAGRFCPRRPRRRQAAGGRPRGAAVGRGDRGGVPLRTDGANRGIEGERRGVSPPVQPTPAALRRAARLGNASQRSGRMSKPRSAVADYAVYLILRVVLCVVQMLTLPAARRLAGVLAWLAYHVDRRHRLVADENLKQAFPGQYDDGERDRMVRAVYRHFCSVVIEIAHLPRKLNPETWRRYVTLENGRAVVEALLCGRPLLFVTGHLGNWELGGYVLGLLGFTTHAIARQLDNPYLNDFLLYRFRQRTGQRILYKDGDFERIQGVLASGGVIATLGDQDAGRRGQFVDFFGRPASTHKAVALWRWSSTRRWW